MFAYHDHTPGFERDYVGRSLDFYRRDAFLLTALNQQIKIAIPEDAEFNTHREWLLIKLSREVEGRHYPSSALLAANFDDYLAGKRRLQVLFTPDRQKALSDHSSTRDHIILSIMDNVVSCLEVLTPRGERWQRRPLGDQQTLNSLSAGGIDEESNDYFMTVEGFLQPTSLFLGNLDGGEAERLKQGPNNFDPERYQVSQHFARSKDGTRVPYFQIVAKDIQLHGANPTLLNAYGGFDVSLLPHYMGSEAPTWLARGGVYVVANIRGGGSNGGLLVGNMLTLYPALFGCIVCEVPLLDMQRYTQLSAGASWIAEYGDPEDLVQWEYIKTFSPYHNIQAEIVYPPVLFYTATSDDRVNPAHARKMAARMRQMGHEQVYFYENTEGGHSAAADKRQAAFHSALTSEFLWSTLNRPIPVL